MNLRKELKGAIVLILVYAVFASQTRSAVLALIAVSCLLLLVHLVKSFSRKTLVIFGLVLLSVFVLSFSNRFKDISFSKDYYCFLTDLSNLSSYFDSLTQFSSISCGYDMKEFLTKYDWTKNNFTQSTTGYNQTQFLGIVDKNLNFNIYLLHKC